MKYSCLMDCYAPNWTVNDVALLSAAPCSSFRRPVLPGLIFLNSFSSIPETTRRHPSPTIAFPPSLSTGRSNILKRYHPRWIRRRKRSSNNWLYRDWWLSCFVSLSLHFVAHRRLRRTQSGAEWGALGSLWWVVNRSSSVSVGLSLDGWWRWRRQRMMIDD